MSKQTNLITRPRKLRDLSIPKRAFDNAMISHFQIPGAFFLARFLGFLISYEKDSCIVEFDICEFLQNPRGLLHGGVIATALDVSMGHLVQHLQGPASTIAINVQYHRAISEGHVRCISNVVHRGSRIWSMNAFAHIGSDKLIASATSNFVLL